MKQPIMCNAIRHNYLVYWVRSICHGVKKLSIQNDIHNDVEQHYSHVQRSDLCSCLTPNHQSVALIANENN